MFRIACPISIITCDAKQITSITHLLMVWPVAATSLCLLPAGKAFIAVFKYIYHL